MVFSLIRFAGIIKKNFKLMREIVRIAGIIEIAGFIKIAGIIQGRALFEKIRCFRTHAIISRSF